MTAKHTATPSSRWATNGERDPHGGSYDCKRAGLALGDLTDDELANAVFMHGNEQPRIEDVIAGRAKMPIVYLTAAKDRIRWLSRSLEKSIAAQAAHDDLVTAAEEALRLIEWLDLIGNDGVEIYKHEIRAEAERFRNRIAPALAKAKGETK